MAVMACGIPAPLFDALQRAEERFPQVSWGLTLQDGEWRILGACRGRHGEARLRACVVNHDNLAAVLDHYVGEVAKEVLQPQ